MRSQAPPDTDRKCGPGVRCTSETTGGPQDYGITPAEREGRRPRHGERFSPRREWGLPDEYWAAADQHNSEVEARERSEAAARQGQKRAYDDMRTRVLAEQDGVCALCPAEASELHHVVRRADGGSDDRENLAGLCHRCHRDVAHPHGTTGSRAAGVPLALLGLLA